MDRNQLYQDLLRLNTPGEMIALLTNFVDTKKHLTGFTKIAFVKGLVMGYELLKKTK
jgi:hypothetical protein